MLATCRRSMLLPLSAKTESGSNLTYHDKDKVGNSLFVFLENFRVLDFHKIDQRLLSTINL